MEYSGNDVRTNWMWEIQDGDLQYGPMMNTFVVWHHLGFCHLSFHVGGLVQLHDIFQVEKSWKRCTGSLWTWKAYISQLQHKLSKQIPSATAMFSGSSRLVGVMRMRYDRYEIVKSKMAAVKPEIHWSQLKRMMVKQFQWLWFWDEQRGKSMKRIMKPFSHKWMYAIKDCDRHAEKTLILNF